MKTKICTKCKVEKSLYEFGSNKQSKDGKRSHCKECVNRHSKKYRQEHKEKIAIYTKRYHQEHREEAKIYSKKFHEAHKEECNNYSKKYKLEHKEEIKFYNQKYRQEHQEEIAIQCKKYNDSHKEQRNKYRNKRHKTDIRFKTESNLRGRIGHAIRGNTKSLSTMMLIGCEIDYLMHHLQSQFKDGMTWDNHNLHGWHIDHVRPCTSFDLSKESEQRKCFHYSNLQPLWAKDNLKKHNSI